MNYNELTAHELLDLLKSNKISAQMIYESVHQAIDRMNPYLKTYVHRALQKPDFVNDKLGDYPIPLANKDNICIKGEEISCASKILQGFKAPYDATVIEKLKQWGVPFMGQANMDEFAFGSSTENSYFGPTKNPWDLECVPGGSSGGSAAAVASHQAIWALGSDTGGSIRQPASFCGVVGLKPTYGRVSRYGLIAFASSLDQIGPITKDVRDCALLLNLIAGYDERDSTSANVPVRDYTKAFEKPIQGLTIGLPKECFVEGLSSEVRSAFEEAVEVLKKQGVVFKEISLPHSAYSVATYYIVATAEASSNLARFDGVQFGFRAQPDAMRKNALVDMYEETRGLGFGSEAKRRIMLGTYCLSSGYYDAYYLRGQKVRTLIKQDFDEAFKTCDAIMMPTAPTTAFKIGEKSNDPLSMYLSDIYTISANLAGIPAISLPGGFSKAQLPIGLQILAKPFDEEMVLRVAYHFEQQTPWHKVKVNLKRLELIGK